MQRCYKRLMTLRFSIIIPTLNEAAKLPACLARVQLLTGTNAPDSEIIVADGGSSDATVAIAESYGVQVCHCPRGRGVQCNAGAAQAIGDVLLFLYADTLLPDNAFPLLQRFFADEKVQIGSFRLQFDMKHPFLDVTPFFSQFDTVYTRFGDQCIVVRRAFFDALGGFPDFPIFEDTYFFEQARTRTRIYSFPACVTTSARRYIERGVLENHLFNLGLIAEYLLGISPHAIARRYWRGG